MNKLSVLLFAISFLLFSCSDKTEKRKLIFSDEFDGNSLDESIWVYDLGDGCPNLCGWGNQESQTYTKNNHEVKDGFLTITAKKEDSLYTSTRIKTQGKFSTKYGKVEMRAKLPKGMGTWPAFWMLGDKISEIGWPLAGEIDIMEYAGKDPITLHTTLHTKDAHGSSPTTSKVDIEGLNEGFHTFAVDWKADKMDFSVDDEIVYTFAPEELDNEEVWPFDEPFFILLNFAVGGHFGGFEIDDSVFPQKYVIDYVRVYE